MLRRRVPDISIDTDQGRAILAEQFRTLREQVPLMYALMFIDATFLAFASQGSTNWLAKIGIPILLMAVCLIRATFWIRRRAITPDPVAIQRYIASATLVSGLLSLGFGGWGLYLYFEADLVRRACIALYILIGAMGCCYCLQSLPRAGYFVLLCGAAPVTLCLVLTDDWFLRGLGVNNAVAAIVILRMLHNSYAGFIEVVVSRSDMATEQRRAQGAEQQAHQLAYHDPLTGLPNRRALAEALDGRVEQAASDERFALLLLDLDRFKTINDVHGHPAGDQLLRDVAVRLGTIAGADGLAYRLGGDEFAIVVEGDGEAARRVARSIVKAMARPFAEQDRVHHIGASVGIALYPSDAGDCDALLRRADIALYKAKQSGRGQHCAFEPVLDAEICRRAVLEQEMRAALAADAFVPFYQPIVGLSSGTIFGFELLARWRRGDGSEVGPDQFIPIAEECGLINELTLKLLRRACAETRAWGTNLAVNVSPTQLRDPWFAQVVLAVLKQERYPPERLTIEITENALIVDADSAKATITSLKNQGIKLALDDFGTGYSSLQHLQMLPFDKIKIDRSFVAAMEHDDAARRLVSAIIALAGVLRLPVVAEGIESPSTAKALARLGCAMGQGYHFGPPMAREDVEAQQLVGWERQAANA